MTFTLNDIITTKIPKYSKKQHLFKHKTLLSVTKNFQNIENQLFYLENILLKKRDFPKNLHNLNVSKITRLSQSNRILTEQVVEVVHRLR